MADSKHVLVVEDEKPLAHALQLKLESQGFTVTITSDGQEGLTALETGAFDVALVDLMMPVMNGFELLEAIGKKDVKTKIIVLSNLSQKEDEERVFGLGATGFFIKSDTPLSQIIEEVNKL